MRQAQAGIFSIILHCEKIITKIRSRNTSFSYSSIVFYYFTIIFWSISYRTFGQVMAECSFSPFRKSWNCCSPIKTTKLTRFPQKLNPRSTKSRTGKFKLISSENLHVFKGKCRAWVAQPRKSVFQKGEGKGVGFWGLLLLEAQIPCCWLLHFRMNWGRDELKPYSSSSSSCMWAERRKRRREEKMWNNTFSLELPLLPLTTLKIWGLAFALNMSSSPLFPLPFSGCNYSSCFLLPFSCFQKG